MQRLDGRIRRVIRDLELTSRETEIAERVAQGCATEDIATALDIAVATVRTHIRNILVVVGVANRVELLALIMRRVVKTLPRTRRR